MLRCPTARSGQKQLASATMALPQRQARASRVVGFGSSRASPVTRATHAWIATDSASTDRTLSHLIDIGNQAAQHGQDARPLREAVRAGTAAPPTHLIVLWFLDEPKLPSLLLETRCNGRRFRTSSVRVQPFESLWVQGHQSVRSIRPQARTLSHSSCTQSGGGVPSH